MMDVDDPWYTGDFEAAYQDIYRGCEALINKIEKVRQIMQVYQFLIILAVVIMGYILLLKSLYFLKAIFILC